VLQKLVPVAIALTLFAGCGGGNDTREQIRAIEDQQRDLGGPADPLSDATAEQSACIESGASDGNLDLQSLLTDATATGLAQRAAFANVVVDCIPQLGSLGSYRTQFTTTVNAALGAGVDVDEIEGGCLLQYVVDNSPDPGIALADGSSPEDLATITDGFQACFDETSLATLFREEGTGAQNYGDDADLDALHDLCVAGSDAGCDLLYNRSSVGSEYESVAVGCGGRSVGAGACTAGLDFLADGTIDPQSPALLDFEAGCTNGDMTSCDALFTFSPSGSELEQFGFTCGGRIAVGAIPDCRTRFAE
jgi:hypothetical protein